MKAVADTSLLNYLIRIGDVYILAALFETITIQTPSSTIAYEACSHQRSPVDCLTAAWLSIYHSRGAIDSSSELDYDEREAIPSPKSSKRTR